jgi:hypothetical protein
MNEGSNEGQHSEESQGPQHHQVYSKRYALHSLSPSSWKKNLQISNDPFHITRSARRGVLAQQIIPTLPISKPIINIITNPAQQIVPTLLASLSSI